MADTGGRWVTVGVQLPSTVTAVGSLLDSLVGTLISILSVVQAILDVVKAFLPGSLDPVAVIVAGLIAEAEQLLDAIRQIGAFVSGDLKPDHPFDELLGGFQAYERRMVARLADRADPTRPDFPAGTTVVGVFMYRTFAPSATQQALAFIDRIKAFLAVRGAPRANPVPVGLEVSYGASATGAGLFGVAADTFRDGEVPSVANVRWRLAPPAGAGAVAWPLPAPAGFLIEVSTVPDGLTLTYMTATARAGLDEQGQQRQSLGLILDPDGKPFKLYGGPDVFDESDLAWSSSGTTFTPPTGDGSVGPGKTQLYAYRSSADNVAVPLAALSLDGKAVLQRAFLLDVRTVLGASLASPGQPFSFNLRQEDMPYDATFASADGGKVEVTVGTERAREVFVRVSAVTQDYIDSPDNRWVLGQSDVEAGAARGMVRCRVGGPGVTSAKGTPSAALRVAFPRPTGADYLDAVATALAIVVLSRSDLVAVGTEDVSFQLDVAGEPTGLEDVGRYVVPRIAGGSNVARFFQRSGLTPQVFRSRLLARCRILADDLLARTGPPSVALESLVATRATVDTPTGSKPLGKVLWSDLDPDLGPDVTILASLDVEGDGADATSGVAPNPLSVGIDEDVVAAVAPRFARLPGFLSSDAAAESAGATPIGRGSSDYSPVLYDGPQTMKLCRNVFLANPTVLRAANLVLQVAAAPIARSSRSGEGSWHAVRFFPQALPEADAAVGEVVAYLQGLKAGTQSVSETIDGQILFLQARILELEALLRRINALLDVTTSIEVPSASGLVVTGAGTDGVLQALLSAEDKPQDDATVTSRVDASGRVVKSGEYGAGVVILFGGLPTVAVDLLDLMFREEP